MKYLEKGKKGENRNRLSAGACAAATGFGRVMDCLFCATHFLINQQPHLGGKERESESERSSLTKEYK